MNVKALIKELEKYDEDLLVVVDGYEDGVTEKFKLLQVNINTTPALYLQRERLSSDRS